MKTSPIRNHSGFTLIEVLATIMLIAIALPSVMSGLGLASHVADNGRHRTEASGLAQTEMALILASQSWQTGSASGNFGSDWPEYTWEMQVNAWPGDTLGVGLQEIDLVVSWSPNNSNSHESFTLCSMAYPRTTATSTTTGLP